MRIKLRFWQPVCGVAHLRRRPHRYPSFLCFPQPRMFDNRTTFRLSILLRWFSSVVAQKQHVSNIHPGHWDLIWHICPCQTKNDYYIMSRFWSALILTDIYIYTSHHIVSMYHITSHCINVSPLICPNQNKIQKKQTNNKKQAKKTVSFIFWWRSVAGGASQRFAAPEICRLAAPPPAGRALFFTRPQM